MEGKEGGLRICEQPLIALGNTWLCQDCRSKHHNNPFFAGLLELTFPYGWKPAGKTYEWRTIKHISKIDSCEDRTAKFCVWICKCNIFHSCRSFSYLLSIFSVVGQFSDFSYLNVEISTYWANTHYSSFFVYINNIHYALQWWHPAYWKSVICHPAN